MEKTKEKVPILKEPKKIQIKLRESIIHTTVVQG
jgi:hypothetical protein